ncbi:putative pathogenicity factor [Aspergillus mulundensis]|uniref:Uncharacterized protein n=1 Tax=Aspergillus mulundensis TaxID=1810919 RepID=A0A3D8RES2_9EURO|nr:hypothetical protein DSM5745_07600 [Aspergillus mulundensis]RDW72428.1 hypothetical protein DSM5745_07600 [Aspergillus mulundensis]
MPRPALSIDTRRRLSARRRTSTSPSSSGSDEDRPFRRRSRIRYRPSARIRARRGENRTRRHSWFETSRERYNHWHPELEAEPEREFDSDPDHALSYCDESTASPESEPSSPGDPQGPLLIDDGEYVSSGPTANRYVYVLDMRRRAGDNDDDEECDGLDGVSNDGYDSELDGDFEPDEDESPEESLCSLDCNSQDQDQDQDHTEETDSTSPTLDDPAIRQREMGREFLNRGAARASGLIDMRVSIQGSGNGAEIYRGCGSHMRRCRPCETDFLHDGNGDDGAQVDAGDEQNPDRFYSPEASARPSGCIAAESRSRQDDLGYAFDLLGETITETGGYTIEDELAQTALYEDCRLNRTGLKDETTPDNDGYTVGASELCQSVILEDIKQNRLKRVPSTDSKKERGTSQVSCGENEQRQLAPPSARDSRIWSNFRCTDTEICDVDDSDSDTVTETCSTPSPSPARARSRVEASDRDVGRKSHHAGHEPREDESLSRHRRQGHSLKQGPGPGSEQEHGTEDNDAEERAKDGEGRSSENGKSDNDTDDNIVPNPPPSSPFTEYFSAESEDEDEEEGEEKGKGEDDDDDDEKGNVDDLSPLAIPPETPDSEPRCNFSYPNPCAECKSDENPYLRKVISHVFGRNKKVTRQMPRWIWVYYCRKHYQRARYRSRLWAEVQCDRVLDLLDAIKKWGMVSGFTVQLRNREVERLAGLASSAGGSRSRGRGRGRGRGCGGQRGARSGEKGKGRARARDQTPTDASDEDPIQPGKQQKQKRPPVPAPVPTWLRSWIQRHQGHEVSIEEVKELIQKVKRDLDTVQDDEDVRFPDIEILPVYKEGWPPATDDTQAPPGNRGGSVRGRARSAPARASIPGSGGRRRRGSVRTESTNSNVDRPCKRRKLSDDEDEGPRKH